MPRNNRKAFSSDRSGRVPFSIVAVLILVGSAATGAYMQQASREAGERRGMPAGAFAEPVLPGLRAGLADMAARCIDSAVDLQTGIDMDEASQGLWSVDQNFRRFFDIELKKEWGLRQFGRYCLTVEAGESTLQLSTSPMTIRAINRLGMAVNMTAPAGFSISGAVNFTFTGQGQKLQKQVDFAVDRPSWYPLALFQANRLRRDCVNEGLLELLFREMFRGYLDADFAEVLEARNRTRREDQKSTATVGDWWKNRPFEAAGFNAVDFAMMMEEQSLFGGSRHDWFGGMIGVLGERPVALHRALDHPAGMFSGAVAFNESDSTGLEISFAPFLNGMTAVPVNGSGRGAVHFDFSVGSGWGERPQPFYRKVSFAGEEVGVDVYVLEVYVNGVYRLKVGPDDGHMLSLDIPVHLQFTMDHRIHEQVRDRAEEGRRHCEIEDLELFQREYAGLYSTPVAVSLDITNSSGVRALGMPGSASIDVSLDCDYLGTFRRGEVGPGGLVLTNVPSGPHEISVTWTDPQNRQKEEASGSRVLAGPVERLELSTRAQSDTSLFWTYALCYLRDAPAAERLTRLVQFLSLQAGHPVPGGLGSVAPGSPEYTQLMSAWLVEIEGSLCLEDAPLKIADSSRSRMLGGASCVVKVLRESMKYIANVVRFINEWDDSLNKIPLIGPEISYFSEDGGETMSLRVVGASGEGSLSMGRPAGELHWKVIKTDYQSNSVKQTFTANRRLGIAAALDIGTTLLMVLSAYFKAVKYQSSDGQTTESERLDLTAECYKLVAQASKVIVKYAVKPLTNGIANGARMCDRIALGLGVVISLITLFQLAYDENVKFRGDPETWSALFSGLDSATVGFYFALGSLVVGILDLIVFCGYLTAVQPWMAPITAVIALLAVIVFMVMDWKSFSTVVSGTLTDEDRDRMAGSIQGTLRDTAGTVARLNEYPADQEMLAARQARGSASMLSAVSLFVPDMRLAFETSNLSRYQYDTAWAKEHQARSVRSLRFFMIAMWKQVDEFGGAGWTALHPLHEQKWDSRLTVTWPDGEKAEIELGAVQRFLLELNLSNFEKTKIEFRITGRVVADRLNLWMDPLARIGDQVRLWSKRLAASQTMKEYLFGLDGMRYRNDWGYLQVRLSPTYTSCRLAVTGQGPFEFRDGKTAAASTVFTTTLSGREEPHRFYLAPGKYSLEFSDQSPDLKLNQRSRRAAVEVGDLYSPLIGQDPVNVMPEPDCIFFQIFNEYNGSIKVSAEVVDEDGLVIDCLGTAFAFNNTTKQGGKEYINSGWVPGFCFDGTLGFPSEEQQRSLTFRIRFTVELDRESDGLYEQRSTRTVGLGDIRNDHRAMMQKDNGKFTDQLGYKLTVLNEPLKQKYSEDADGNGLWRDQYIEWKKMD